LSDAIPPSSTSGRVSPAPSARGLREPLNRWDVCFLKNVRYVVTVGASCAAEDSDTADTTAVETTEVPADSEPATDGEMASAVAGGGRHTTELPAPTPASRAQLQ